MQPLCNSSFRTWNLKPCRKQSLTGLLEAGNTPITVTLGGKKKRLFFPGRGRPWKMMERMWKLYLIGFMSDMSDMYHSSSVICGPAVHPLLPFPFIHLPSSPLQKCRQYWRLVQMFLEVSWDDLKTPVLPISFVCGWTPVVQFDARILAGENSLWGWDGTRLPLV